MKCECCGKSLDACALERHEKFQEGGYCTDCSTTKGKLFDVLAYFKMPISKEDIEYFDIYSQSRKHLEYPFSKCPSLWHEKACKMFPGWRDVVSHFRRLNKIRYFDKNAILDLIEFVREHTKEKSYEETVIQSLDEIVSMIKHELGETAKSVLDSAAEVKVAANPPSFGLLEQVINISNVQERNK